MRVAWMVVLSLGLSLALPARAADASGDAQAAAVALSKLVLTAESYKELFDKMTEAIAANPPPGEKPLPKEFWAKFRKGIEKVLPRQEMLDDEAGLLVKYYTADEIKQLAAFYATPLGQKALKIMPALSADIMASMQNRMQERLPGFIKQLQDESGLGPDAPAPAPAKKK